MKSIYLFRALPRVRAITLLLRKIYGYIIHAIRLSFSKGGPYVNTLKY